MKLELPLTILLLAGAFCAWWFQWLEKPSSNLSQPTNSAQMASDAVAQEQLGNFDQIEAQPLIQKTIDSLRASPPLEAQIELAIVMFAETFEMKGMYRQAGQGTPLCRFDIRSEDTGEALAITQIFDGRFYYVMESSDMSNTLKFVDLNQVALLSKPRIDWVAGVKGWFGTGGFVPLLEQISGEFSLKTIRRQEMQAPDGTDLSLVTILATWKPEALKQLLREQIQADWLKPEIQWARLPKQLPHEIELTIGVDENGFAFPYKIVFFQYDDRLASESAAARQPSFAVSVRQIKKLAEIDKNWFQVSGEGLESEDLTSEYLTRIKMFLNQPAK